MNKGIQQTMRIKNRTFMHIQDGDKFNNNEKLDRNEE
jgi:hypothetical protein